MERNLFLDDTIPIRDYPDKNMLMLRSRKKGLEISRSIKYAGHYERDIARKKLEKIRKEFLSEPEVRKVIRERREKKVGDTRWLADVMKIRHNPEKRTYLLAIDRCGLHVYKKKTYKEDDEESRKRARDDILKIREEIIKTPEYGKAASQFFDEQTAWWDYREQKKKEKGQ